MCILQSTYIFIHETINLINDFIILLFLLKFPDLQKDRATSVVSNLDFLVT